MESTALKIRGKDTEEQLQRSSAILCVKLGDRCIVLYCHGRRAELFRLGILLCKAGGERSSRILSIVHRLVLSAAERSSSTECFGEKVALHP